MGAKGTEFSRREFARRAALVSAATLVPPDRLSTSDPGTNSLPKQSPNAPSLSPESQAEVDNRYQTILKLYGSRLSEAQRTDLQRLCLSGQQAIDRLRAYDIENGDNPALYLKPLLERERRPLAPNAASESTPVVKKP